MAKLIPSVGKSTVTRFSFSETRPSWDIVVRSWPFTALEIKPYGDVGAGDATAKAVASAVWLRPSM